MSKEKILEYLSEVKDPEIPVLDIVEMGIVRDIHVDENSLTVDITPTYSGCPAMKMIEEEIFSTLESKGIDDIRIDTVLTPAWSTDWIGDDAMRKLKEYGIAPPVRISVENSDPTRQTSIDIPCPFCDSNETEKRSDFGSTACKSLYYCNGCEQPFEHFKCH